MTAHRPLTVVMPAYNEEFGIARSVADIQTNVLTAIPGADFIVVNDGSRDRTGAILDELASHDARIRVVHQSNGGHGRALLTGVDLAQGDYIFLIDSDRQIPLDRFRDLWSHTRDHDAVFGVRRRRGDAMIRRQLTWVIRAALWLMGIRIHDANVPFKLFRREHWLEVRKLIPDDTLAPSLFLAVYLKERGVTIQQVDVPHRAHSSTLSAPKLARFCWKAFGQLLRFRWSLRQR
jgi:dolichol-phosphate mannosyltransferase